MWTDKQSETRKSSCVNARGIPTAAYQVLHLLACMGGPPAGGVPLVRGYPSPSGPGRGYPSVWILLGYLPPPAGPPCGQWTNRRMDRHVSKHNLPSYYLTTRSVNITSRLVLRTRSVNIGNYLCNIHFQDIHNILR